MLEIITPHVKRCHQLTYISELKKKNPKNPYWNMSVDGPGSTARTLSMEENSDGENVKFDFCDKHLLIYSHYTSFLK
jgi:hypothetical protein